MDKNNNTEKTDIKDNNTDKRKMKPSILAIIILDIVAIIGAIIYLLVSSANMKTEKETVYVETVSEEAVQMTEEEFLASWDSYDSDLSTAQVGDVVNFGRYEQDGVSANYLEVIEWDVLEVNDDSVLLISHEVIDQKPYHYAEEPITWEYCTLRQWLNNDFINTAFNDNEKARIKTVPVDNPDSTVFFDQIFAEYELSIGTAGGNPTEDRVFLLSYEELMDYYGPSFNDDIMTYTSDKLMVPCAEALPMSQYGYTTWWLRSPGDFPQFAMYVSGDYLQGLFGTIDDDQKGIRPVMWVAY